MRWARRLGAGVVDSGVASAAALVTTLYSAHFFTLRELGSYAVFFTAFVFTAGVVSALAHTPAEVAVLATTGRPRVAALAAGGWLGAVLGLALGAPVLAVCSSMLDDQPYALRLQLALPTLGLVLVSPAQDHARRLLHSAGMSDHAAAVSGLHLIVTSGTLLASTLLSAPEPLVPGLALLAGNVVSLGLAVAVSRHVAGSSPSEALLRLRRRDLLRTGRWLAAAALLSYSAPLVTVLVLSHVLDIGVVGEVEGVRILGQPLLVLGSGVLSVLAPRLYATGRQREGAAARRLVAGFAGGMTAITVAYALVVAVEWPGSPLPDLFPAAYATSALLAAQLVAVLVGVATVPLSSLLIGAGRQSRLLIAQVASLIATTAAVGVLAGTAPLPVPFAGPLSLLAGELAWGAVAVVLCARALRPGQASAVQDGAGPVRGPASAVRPRIRP